MPFSAVQLHQRLTLLKSHPQCVGKLPNSVEVTNMLVCSAGREVSWAKKFYEALSEASSRSCPAIAPD